MSGSRAGPRRRPPAEELQDDPLVVEIAEAARRLVELRRNWLNPENASEAELKKRTLTNLYNQRPTWLANAHDRLDRAVFAAYGGPPELTARRFSRICRPST